MSILNEIDKKIFVGRVERKGKWLNYKNKTSNNFQWMNKKKTAGHFLDFL